MVIKGRGKLPVAGTTMHFAPAQTIFSQGDRCAAVMYIESGRVQLTAVSKQGRRAVVGVLPAGTFFGEGALAGQRRRTCNAEAMTASAIVVVKTGDMRRSLHEDTRFAQRFLSHLLVTSTRIETDLLAQLFNRSDRRLARVLLLLAGFDGHQLPRHPLPIISRTLLAEVIGATRSKVDLLMNDFRKRGFLERQSGRDGGIQVHRSMLSLVLQD